MYYRILNITKALIVIFTILGLSTMGFAQDTPADNYNTQDASGPCGNLYFDLKKGTLNDLKPDAPMYLVKSKLPCFTGETAEGSDINYGGGVFYINHDFFFYTHKDYIRSGEILKESCLSISLEKANPRYVCHYSEN